MNVAFGVVFAVFVVLILGLSVIAVRWGIRRDRAAREERRDRGPKTPEGWGTP